MNRKTLFFLMIIFFASKCSIIFEQDLSMESILVNLPVDGSISPDTSQLFWWEMVDGALGYNLQIVSGSFEQPLKLLIDTNATDNKFIYNLQIGDYEWRINGWNNSSQTEYIYNKLTILEMPAYEE